MISPIAKFALALAKAIDDQNEVLQTLVLRPAEHQDLADIEQRIAEATAEFKATGGAE